MRYSSLYYTMRSREITREAYKEVSRQAKSQVFFVHLLLNRTKLTVLKMSTNALSCKVAFHTDLYTISSQMVGKEIQVWRRKLTDTTNPSRTFGKQPTIQRRAKNIYTPTLGSYGLPNY